MRVFRFFIMVLALVFSFSLPALAVDYDEGEGGVVVASDSVPTTVTVYDSVADNPDYELTNVVLRSVGPVTPSDTSGLKAAMLQVLGDYDPIIAEYQYTSSQGYVSYLREVQPDYCWIASAALLGLVIFCLFRLGGALIDK